MLRIVIDRTTDAMRAEVSSLYLVERRGLTRLVRATPEPPGDRQSHAGLGEGITGWVANARVPLTVRDVHAEPRWKVALGRRRPVHLDARVPLVIRDEVIAMNVQTVEVREFERGEIDFADDRESGRRDHREEPPAARRRAQAARGLGAVRGVERSPRRSSSTRCSAWWSIGSCGCTRAQRAASS
jgi:hypothetical protein